MSQRSIKTHIAGLLDGLKPSTMRDALTVSEQLPSITVMEGPLGWVWISDGAESRFAGSHGTGYKAIEYTVETVIAHDIDLSSTDVDQGQFDDLLELISYTLRNADLGVTLTDSITGRTSNLMNMGEDIAIHREEPAALMDQGLVRYVATITTNVKEITDG